LRPRPTSTPFEPAPGTVNHLLTARLRPDFKRAVCYGLLALVAATVVRVYGDLSWSSLSESLAAGVGSMAFVALSVQAVRSAVSEVAAVSRTRFGDAHASVVALLLTLAGYTAVVLALLVVLQVPVQRLLVSGAVTGVVLGIAAQQSLSNVVAGLVLLLNRPFQVGHEVTLRSGSLAGPYSGRVLSIGLTYVRLDTEEGVVLIPNSGVLGAVVGPRVQPPVVPAQERADSTF
jgi:small-conductance mechanosensitive channel